ncbi:MAG: SAP domain-containing protein, partial [Polyangiaceae bacterium]
MADDQIGPDEPEGDDAPTWEQYADPSETFSTEELLGEIRSTSVRGAPDFLAWLGTHISMEVRTVERKLAAWHGHGSLRRVFAEQWEQIVGAAPGTALGSLTAAQVRGSPSLVRLLADSAGIAPRDAYARFADATASSRADAVLPGLAEEKVPQQAAHSYDPQGHRETHDDARSVDPQVLRAGHTDSGPATDRESRETEVVQIASSLQPLPSGRKREILDVLKADRLRELVRGLDLHVDSYRDRDALIGALADGRRVDFRAVLARLSRDELKEMCGAGGLSAGGKEKGVLVERLLGEAAGPRDRGTSASDEGDRSPPPKTPAAGTRSNLSASKKRDAL